MIKTEKKKSAKPRVKTRLQGLCSTCIHAENCSLIADKKKPVQFCNEFETETKASKPKKTTRRKTVFHKNAPKGLCQTCENYPHCVLKKPESGVWSCEEYK